MPDEPLIAARGLALGYGDQAVVRDVTLAVRAGEFWCWIGPNGCGKSTLLRGLLGLLPPLAGVALIVRRRFLWSGCQWLFWATIALGSSSPPEPDWNQLITDVAEVRFFYGDPTMFFIFQGWNLGVDNPTISYGLFSDGFESGDTSAWSATVP